MRIPHLYPIVLSIVFVILASVAYVHWHAMSPTYTGSTTYQTTLPSAADSIATSSGTISGTATSSSQAPSTYTAAQVAMHANASSCWTSINGGVYDVTTWINQHPGGTAPILSLCGHDGSAAFNAPHGGQSRPASELASFKIGTLQQ